MHCMLALPAAPVGSALAFPLLPCLVCSLSVLLPFEFRTAQEREFRESEERKRERESKRERERQRERVRALERDVE